MVRIRPLAPSDRRLIIEGFERLSPASRYRRFFAPVRQLTEQQLDYLTRVDQHDHVALVAIDDESGAAVGVARFVRNGPSAAEPAIVVADDWQGRGVATALLDRLVNRAREEGVTRFVAPVLADNGAAVRVLRRLGDTTVEAHGPELELVIDLPGVPDRSIAPDAPLRQLLRTVAAGTVVPAIVFWHRLLPRPGLPRDQLRDVVVCDDGEAAVDVAAGLAAAWGAALVIVGAGHPGLSSRREIDARLRQRAERARGRVGERGVEVRTVGRLGDLGARLLDAAAGEQARLIVVSDPASEVDSAGGGPGVAGRLLGQTWDHVSHNARCDVLVARRRAAG